MLVELAQNAADAAAATGRPGRLLLRLADGVLTAANTGAALDRAGVQALSTLRASTKRGDGTVGRFGVGFAAVVAVTDEPSIAGPEAGVRWSARRCREQVAQRPELADELARRAGVVPLLRLPFTAPGRREPGYDTVVWLPLRDAAAAGLVRGLLAALDPTMLLSLPALAEVMVEVDGTRRVLACAWDSGDLPELAGRRPLQRATLRDAEATTEWSVVRAQGQHRAEDLADRPVEERSRPGWSLLWAVPLDGAGAPASRLLPQPRTLHAPTPTDEPLDLPALLVATLPLDPTRRHVADGPATEAVVRQAVRAYRELVTGSPPGTALVPGPVPVGGLDARLRRSIVAALREVAFLPGAAGSLLAPPDAVACPELDAEVSTLVAEAVPGLLAPGLDRQALAVLDVARLGVGDVIDRLGGLARPATWWQRLYGALERCGLPLAALEGLPVPLLDGRTVTGPRAVLLAPADEQVARAAQALSRFGLRLADPQATHPLLERLGAVRADAASVLAHPTTRAAVRAAWDEPDASELVDAVLDLVAAAATRPGEHQWLAELPLPDADGGLTPAGELVLAGSPLAQVLEPGALGIVADGLARAQDRSALLACGVLERFALGRGEMVSIAEALEDPDLDVEGLEEWASDTGADGGPVAELLVVRDLDLVADDRWPQALEMLADPPLRDALLTPARVLDARGGWREVTPYAAWWLGRHARLAGNAPRNLLLPGAQTCLRGLYPSAPTDLDPVLLGALGARVTLAQVLGEPGGADDLLDRLADPAAEVDLDALRTIYQALAAVDPASVQPPDRIRIPAGISTSLADADEVLIATAPHWAALARTSQAPTLPGPATLAEVLDLLLVEQRHPGRVTSSGSRRTVPELAAQVLGEAHPRSWWSHDDLCVDGLAVDWWLDDDGEPHAATRDGLACALAWAAGRWDRRWLLAAVLERPAEIDLLLADDAF